VFSKKTKTATTIISFVKAHKRVSDIIFSWVVFCALVLMPNWREGPFYFLFFSTLFVTLIASQLFWIPRVVGVGERFILVKRQRLWFRIVVGVVYLFFFACNFGPWNTPQGDSTHLTLRWGLVGVAGWVVGGFRLGDGFLDSRPSGAWCRVALPQSAQGCGAYPAIASSLSSNPSGNATLVMARIIGKPA
jgi:hypothetical protein